MTKIKHSLMILFLSLITTLVYANGCCQGMGGPRYCDSSAGRCVCNNGSYSACYCDRHAVMDLQLLKGCCQWQGGVLGAEGNVVRCNNGSVSEICSLAIPKQEYASW